VLLLLGRKQHSYAQGHMLCLHYTLCLMQLSVVHNLILMRCSDDIPVSGLLVIDAVGWRSMYIVVMPRVNRIVIFLTYHVYLYSINCPTVICLPSMLLFILWRDTTSELWTPVLFPSYIAIKRAYVTRITTRFTLGITIKYIDHHPIASMTNNPLAGISSEHPISIKLRTTDNCIKQSV
jgi:hypothetical protein